MVDIQSTRTDPVTLSGYSALGDGVIVQHGATLNNQVTVFPRLRIAAGVQAPAKMVIQSAEQVLALPQSRADELPTPRHSTYEPLAQLALAYPARYGEQQADD